MTRSRLVFTVSLLALTWFAQHSAALAGAVYWDHAAGGNGHVYEYVGKSLGFDAAQAAAAARSVGTTSGHLATIQNASENALLRELAFGGSVGNAWIGLSQPDGSPEPADGFQWVTGEPVVYTNWSGSEPNDAGGGEDAAAMYDGGVWNDLSKGYGPYGYLVEYDLASKLHSADVKLTLTGATQLTVQGVLSGTAIGTPIGVQLLGTMDVRLYFDDSNQPLGIVLIDSHGEMANSLGGFLDLGVDGGFNFSVPDATAKLFQNLPTGQFSIINDSGQVQADNIVLTLPTGVVSYSPVGAYVSKVSAGSFPLSDFNSSNPSQYTGPIIPVVTTFDSGTPDARGLKLNLPLTFDVRLIDDASVRIGLNLEAVGEFAIVPEPSSLLLAGSGVFTALCFVAGAKKRRLATKR